MECLKCDSGESLAYLRCFHRSFHQLLWGWRNCTSGCRQRTWGLRNCQTRRSNWAHWRLWLIDGHRRTHTHLQRLSGLCISNRYRSSSRIIWLQPHRMCSSLLCHSLPNCSRLSLGLTIASRIGDHFRELQSALWFAIAEQLSQALERGLRACTRFCHR